MNLRPNQLFLVNVLNIKCNFQKSKKKGERKLKMIKRSKERGRFEKKRRWEKEREKKERKKEKSEKRKRNDEEMRIWKKKK